jgi:glycosyltransferase involved in cell wall biosynthesis
MPPFRSLAVVSYRLGGRDGVSVEAAKWAWAARKVGLEVLTIAGEGTADRLVPGLAWGHPGGPSAGELRQAFSGIDVVVVENLCSLPLNPCAGAAVAAALRGRPAILRHHDLSWQRPQLAHLGPPPHDPAWLHVCINDLSRRQLAEHGIPAITVYNHFDTDAPPGRRLETRTLLGVAPERPLVLQPTRAIPRKNVAGGIAVAEAVGGDYWLTGPAEEGYDGELDLLLGRARVPVHRMAAHALGPDALGPGTGTAAPGAPGPEWVTMADAYAACDAVVLPSTWEGFGNPALESAVYRRPLAIGRYPVASELARFGFHWFSVEEPSALRAHLAHPEPGLADHNLAVARRHFSLADLPERLGALLTRLARGGSR